MPIVKTKNNIVSVLNTRHLTETTYVIRIDRNGMEFKAGQYISLGLPGTADKREYSIYSGTQEDYLENNPADKDVDYYLCGNSNMIHDVYDIPKGQGIEAGNIHAEVYF